MTADRRRSPIFDQATMRAMNKFKLIQWCGLGALALMASSCGKEAPEVDENYEGFWKSVDTECRPWMLIEANGDGRYSAKFKGESCRHNDEHTGRALIRSGVLHIGSFREEITLPPTAIDSVDVPANWEYGPGPIWSTMKLELSGLTYYKIDI